jgi:hypothetical protein
MHGTQKKPTGTKSAPYWPQLKVARKANQQRIGFRTGDFEHCLSDLKQVADKKSKRVGGTGRRLKTVTYVLGMTIRTWLERVTRF